jgi:heterodisulfide reductase subunit C
MKYITPSVLTPDPKLRLHIEQAVRAESHMCWTCRSCANECPVNLATSRLQPIKIVWMANLGLLDELLRAPEIWYRWLNTPVPSSSEKVLFKSRSSDTYRLKSSLRQCSFTACFTCGECSSACPIFYERSVFEPQWIFRMVNLGLTEELMQSPAIWLCVGCQRCTNACSQLVKGNLIIERLKQLAVSEGFVAEKFPFAWKEYQNNLYSQLLDEINQLFGWKAGHSIGSLDDCMNLTTGAVAI